MKRVNQAAAVRQGGSAAQGIGCQEARRAAPTRSGFTSLKLQLPLSTDGLQNKDVAIIALQHGLGNPHSQRIDAVSLKYCGVVAGAGLSCPLLRGAVFDSSLTLQKAAAQGKGAAQGTAHGPPVFGAKPCRFKLAGLCLLCSRKSESRAVGISAAS